LHPDAQGTASPSPACRVDLAPQGAPRQRSGVTTPLLALLTATVLALGSPASGWTPPLATGWEQVLRAFERPDDRFAAGHRGIDVAAPPGAEVRAIGPGRVAFVGDVARTPTVSIEHDDPPWTSTYQPVEALVVEGDRVEMGTLIGHLTAHGFHCSRSCLHLGLRRPAWEARDAMTDPYVDPWAWIERRPVLKPLVP
jgi:murein DD-endopeptidase MepM/ murein hydrolase activator NlpD